MGQCAGGEVNRVVASRWSMFAPAARMSRPGSFDNRQEIAQVLAYNGDLCIHPRFFA